jgi:hypothetical protein
MPENEFAAVTAVAGMMNGAGCSALSLPAMRGICRPALIRRTQIRDLRD